MRQIELMKGDYKCWAAPQVLDSSQKRSKYFISFYRK